MRIIPKGTYGVMLSNGLGQILNQDLSLFNGEMDVRPVIFNSLDEIDTYVRSIRKSNIEANVFDDLGAFVKTIYSTV